MAATGDAGLPFGSYPRLLLAWVCTEAVRTRSPVLTLGDSLADFMRTLGVFSASAGKRGIRTQLRDQMQRLFHTSIRLTARHRIGDMRRESSVAAVVASRTEFWWNLNAMGDERIGHAKGPARRAERGDLAVAVSAVRQQPPAGIRPDVGAEIPDVRPPGAQEDPGGLARAPRPRRARPGRRRREGGGAPDLPLGNKNPAAPPPSRRVTLSLLSCGPPPGPGKVLHSRTT